MFQIISFTICPFVQRVTATLEAKGMPYAVDTIDLSDKPQWFLDLSPTGQVPVLVTADGTALFESDAIVEYIDEISAPLQSGLTLERRARNRAWSYQASKHYLVQCGAMQSADRASYDQRMIRLDASFARVERALHGSAFFDGDTPGNVDMAWLPLLHRAALVEAHSGVDMLAGYRKVKAWQSRLLATDIPARSVAPDFRRTFTDFYLAERTWLGRGANPDEPVAVAKAAGSGGCCG